MTLTESELAEVAVALKDRSNLWWQFGDPKVAEMVDTLYAKIAALNEGADK